MTKPIKNEISIILVENNSLALSIDISSELPKLQPGNFLLFSPDISSKIIKLKARWLYTQHKTSNDIEIKNIREFSK